MCLHHHNDVSTYRKVNNIFLMRERKGREREILKEILRTNVCTGCGQLSQSITITQHQEAMKLHMYRLTCKQIKC